MGFVLDLDGESSIDERDDIFSDKFEIASPNATNSLAEGQCDASERQILHKDINNKFYTDEDGYYGILNCFFQNIFLHYPLLQYFA